MTPKRPKSLKWIGEMYPDGRPARFLDFVPPRDLTEEETDALDQDQLRIIRQHDDLYREVHPPAPKKKTTARASRTRADAPQPTEATNAGDEPTPAAAPATEGEG